MAEVYHSELTVSLTDTSKGWEKLGILVRKSWDWISGWTIRKIQDPNPSLV